MSLIGLLIGMALSAVILAGMLQLFSSMNRSAQLIKNEIELNETLLFVVQNMSKIIAQAGHIRPSTVHKQPLLYTFTASDALTSYPSWFLYTQTSATHHNDLWVRFQHDAAANIQHCDGTVLLPGTDSGKYSRYALTGSFPYDLECNIDDPASIPGQYKTITLAKGMTARLYFTFAEDYNLDGAIDRYLDNPISDIKSGHNRFNYATKAIRVGLIMRTKSIVFPGSTTKSFSLFKNKTATFTDKYLYKSAVFTIPLLDAPQDY